VGGTIYPNDSAPKKRTLDNGELTAVTSVVTGAKKLKFKIDPPDGAITGDYDNGWVLWTSPADPNYNTIQDIKSFVFNSTTDADIVLHEPTPRDIGPLDLVRIYIACNKSREECSNKFDNEDNCGCFEHLPGTDKLLQQGATF
jgi:hypothetical protein